MKKLLALLLAVLMLATMFTGCSQNKKSEDSSSTASTETKAEEKKEEPKKEEPKKEEPKKEEPKKEEPKKKEEKKEEAAPSTKVDEYSLRMSWWGSQVRHDGTIKAIEMYMDKNPNVKIEYEYSGWDGYWDKIAAQAAANELPNIWQQSIAYVKMYADADQILDLQPYVNEGYIDLNDWSQGAVDTTRIDGKLFSLTLGNSAHTILYDPDIFKEAGVDLPDFDWTWDDYKATVKAINENLGIYGDCTFPNMNAKDGLRHYVFSQGYTMYNEDQNALNFPKELMVEYLNWELELQKAGYIADQATQGEITTVEASLLVTGEAAMNSSMNSNMCVATMEAAGKPMAMVCYPHLEGESRWGTVLGPSQLINISNTGTDDDKIESAKFVNFFVNDIDANLVLAAERGVPGNNKVCDAILESDVASEYAKITIEYVNTVGPNTEADPDALRPPADGEIITIYGNYHDQVMFGQISAEDAADGFFKDANALLAK